MQPGPLKHHQRSCLKSKKRLAGALERAKEMWASKKKKCFKDVEGGDESSHQPQVQTMDSVIDDPSTSGGAHLTVLSPSLNNTLYVTN
jgi:hypothetical protein